MSRGREEVAVNGDDTSWRKQGSSAAAASAALLEPRSQGSATQKLTGSGDFAVVSGWSGWGQ